MNDNFDSLKVRLNGRFPHFLRESRWGKGGGGGGLEYPEQIIDSQSENWYHVFWGENPPHQLGIEPPPSKSGDTFARSELSVRLSVCLSLWDADDDELSLLAIVARSVRWIG